jgi:hypothetical protein
MPWGVIGAFDVDALEQVFGAQIERTERAGQIRSGEQLGCAIDAENPSSRAAELRASELGAEAPARCRARRFVFSGFGGVGRAIDEICRARPVLGEGVGLRSDVVPTPVGC